jgi:L-ascorbate metabolism protein UlaG (beta-lactamase superfamily)
MNPEIKYHGHSCFEIIGKDRIIIDPFLKDNPVADIGPDDVEVDIIAVTHAHGDHLGDTKEIAQRTGATVVCIAEITWYLSQFEGIECVAMNMGGTVRVKNTDITMVRADHSSSLQTADGVIAGGQSAGLIIDSGFSVYHLGDTALFMDLKIYHVLYNPEVILVPIGGHFTMGPKQAALAVEWLAPKLAIPMHYDTWDVIKQEPKMFVDFTESVKHKRTSLAILKPGESLDPAPYLGNAESETGGSSDPGPQEDA